jgi:membrane-associated protein
MVLAAGGVLDPEHLLDTFGTLGLFLIIFAESGLLIGFFLPGDSLLFTAGLLSSQDKLAPFPIILLGVFLAAVIGDQVGYLFGRKVGPALFKRPDSRLFKQEYVEKAQNYFEEHGSKTIVLARFVPIVRTFAPFVAGVGQMRYGRFQLYNCVGGITWVALFVWGGFLFGNIPIVKNNFGVVTVLIIVVSLIPVAFGMWRRKPEPAGRG